MAVSDVGVDISLRSMMVHSFRPMVLNVDMVFCGGVLYIDSILDPGPAPRRRLLNVKWLFRASLSLHSDHRGEVAVPTKSDSSPRVIGGYYLITPSRPARLAADDASNVQRTLPCA